MIEKDDIKRFFETKSKSAKSFRDICEYFNPTSQEKRALKRSIKQLVDDGFLVRNRKGQYSQSSESVLFTGFFEAHRDGYGFVILEELGQRDIFIPSKSTMGAMDNDKVIVRVDNKSRREGCIVKIIQRRNKKIVGILDRSRGGFFIRPKDSKIRHDFYVSPKNIGNAREGDMVIADIKEYPETRGLPSAFNLNVINPPKSPKEHIDMIIQEAELTVSFSSTIKKTDVKVKDINRRNLREITTITIDGENAKDFDDAVSIMKTSDGYRLWVHIADVSEYVLWDTPLDLEARARGTSYYFPDRVVPMLPKALSEDLCSLKPNVDRLTFTVEMFFNQNGDCTSSDFYLSIINSNERMTYTTVNQIITGSNPDVIQRYEYLYKDLLVMSELSQIMRQRRKDRGSLDFDLPEPEIILDIRGNPQGIVRAERNRAHFLIEEFMISANEAVARHIDSLQIPSIYRVHEAPDRDRVDEAVLFLYNSGLIKNTHFGGIKDLHKFVSSFYGNQFEELIFKFILKSLKQAKYSTSNIGHFGLASECYTHFTSPIRRYPDLVVHRILKDIILYNEVRYLNDDMFETLLDEIASSSSLSERRADNLENRSVDIMRIWFMKEKIGDIFKGYVINVTSYGLKIRLTDYYIEGFLHVSHMNDDYYRYDEKAVRLVGAHRSKVFNIGKRLDVVVEAIDMDSLEVLFGLPI